MVSMDLLPGLDIHICESILTFSVVRFSTFNVRGLQYVPIDIFVGHFMSIGGIPDLLFWSIPSSYRDSKFTILNVNLSGGFTNINM
jgi:hypothetical protein